MKNDKPVYVTQPSLAPLDEFRELLESPWGSGILTHNGPLVRQFEKELSKKLDINNFVTVVNGTLALQLAIKALNLSGEIITTPFTWIATVSAMMWEGCIPVFADIDKETLNIDPEKIEEKITDKTVAIMPVHVFGNPCDIDAIKNIAQKNNLKIIYDAAHALGSTYNMKSVLEYGDISATSLHATKLLNTAEGGGCVTTDNELYKKLKRIRFFGHNNEKDIVEDGTNLKMTEIHAALGIANLKYFESVLSDRKEKYQYYKKALQKSKMLRFQKLIHGVTNYSYFPIILPSENELLQIENILNQKQIYPRRYFYPSVNTYTKILSYQQCPISEDISKRILCLPLYLKLKIEEMDSIISLILKNVSSKSI